MLSRSRPRRRTAPRSRRARRRACPLTAQVVGNHPTGQDITGELEIKQAQPKYGTTTTGTWFTNNLVKAQVELDGQLAKGLKLEGVSSVQPDTNAITAVLSAQYKLPGLNTKATLDLLKTSITADAVVAQQGFLAGAEATYDVNEAALKRYSLAAGYSTSDYTVSLHALSNLSAFQAAYYHKVNADVEAGAKAFYNTKAGNKVSIEVGAKTYLDNAAFVKTKINSEGVLGLGYTQLLRPGVTATIGALLDTKTLGQKTAEHSKAHSLGLQLKFVS